MLVFVFLWWIERLINQYNYVDVGGKMGTTYVMDTGDIWKDMQTAIGFIGKIVYQNYSNDEIHLVINLGGVNMAMVIFVSHDSKMIGFKDVDEGMGPFNQVPFSDDAIKLLSPVEKIYPKSKNAQRYAIDWRNRQT